MGKKKAGGQASGDAAGHKWLCYYCNTYSKDEQSLIQHQAAKHFTCPYCTPNAFGRNCRSLAGLLTHVKRSHKKDMTAVPGAIEGRESVEVAVYGMSGIPQEILDAEWESWAAEAAKAKEKEEQAEKEAAERKAKKEAEAAEAARRKKEREAKEAKEAAEAAAAWAASRQKAAADEAWEKWEKEGAATQRSPLLNLAANCGLLSSGLGLAAQMQKESSEPAPPPPDKAPIMPPNRSSAAPAKVAVGWGRRVEGEPTIGLARPRTKRWMQRPEYEPFRPGAKVKIWCLVNNAHLNGNTGTVAPCVAKWPGTVEVQVQSGQWVQEFSIRFKNLEVIENVNDDKEKELNPLMRDSRPSRDDPRAPADDDYRRGAPRGGRDDYRRSPPRDAPPRGRDDYSRNRPPASPARLRDDSRAPQRGVSPRARDDYRREPPPPRGQDDYRREPAGPRGQLPSLSPPRLSSPLRGRGPADNSRSRSRGIRAPPQRSSLPSPSPPRGPPRRGDSRDPGYLRGGGHMRRDGYGGVA